jgi:putative transposase
MARGRYRFLNDDTSPYFMTAATVSFLPLFKSRAITNIIIASLAYLIDKRRLTLYAYVIMENHIHLIGSGVNLSRIIGNFKSFTARKCIDYYLEQEQQKVLERLAASKLRHKKDSQYQFWQEGVHPQRILNQDMMRQKITYIHYNPVRAGLVQKPEEWAYSSARDYAGERGLLPVSMEWL